jgi:hypothetical protein
MGPRKSHCLEIAFAPDILNCFEDEFVIERKVASSTPIMRASVQLRRGLRLMTTESIRAALALPPSIGSPVIAEMSTSATSPERACVPAAARLPRQLAQL